MKKLIVLFSVLWISVAVSAQSEIKNDSLTLSMGQNKMFGDFILDGSLFTMAVKQLPSLADLLKTAPSMDGLLQSINQPARWVFGKASADGRPTLLYTNRIDNFYSQCSVEIVTSAGECSGGCIYYWIVRAATSNLGNEAGCHQ
jgi:hypothetical protein